MTIAQGPVVGSPAMPGAGAMAPAGPAPSGTGGAPVVVPVASGTAVLSGAGPAGAAPAAASSGPAGGVPGLSAAPLPGAAAGGSGAAAGMPGLMAAAQGGSPAGLQMPGGVATAQGMALPGRLPPAVPGAGGPAPGAVGGLPGAGAAGATTRPGLAGAPSLSALAALTLGASGPLAGSAGRGAYALQPLPAPAGPAGPGAPASAFPALHEALAALMQVQPGLAQQVRALVPQPNALMGATMLFLLSALRGGDMRAWLGERTARVLEAAGRGDVVGRLAGEFAQLSRQPAEAPAGDWRLFTIPVYGDGDLRPVQVAVRREPGDDGDQGDAGDEPGRRFLIDLTMSRIGPMQFDGHYKAQRFRLTVRTGRLLPGWIRQEIGEVFNGACDAAGLQPALTFQSGAHTWVRPDGVRPGGS